jgi:hypothetical protein
MVRFCILKFRFFFLMTSHQAPRRIDWIPSQRLDQGRPSFLDLPLEIREMVYLAALSTKSTIFLRDQTRSTPPEPQHDIIDKTIDKHISPALLRVSHQMHHEAIEFLYQRNTFKWNFSTITGTNPYLLNSSRSLKGDSDMFEHTCSTYRPLVQKLLLDMRFRGHADLNWLHLFRKANMMTGRYKNLKALHFQVLLDPLMLRHGDWALYFSNNHRGHLEKQALVKECYKRLKATCQLEGHKVPKCLKVTFVLKNSLGECHIVPPSPEVYCEALEMLKLARGPS